MLKDRTLRKVITHRISCGRPNNPTISEGAGKWVHALDHFEITGVEQDPKTLQFAVDYMAMERLVLFGKTYDPKKPRRIPVRLASDNIDDSLTQAYRSRAMMPVTNPDGTPKMVMKRDGLEPEQQMRLQPWCEGDGETAKRLYGGAHVTIPCRASPKCGDRDLAPLVQLLGKKVKHEPLTDTLRCPWAQNAGLQAVLKELPDNVSKVLKQAPTCKPESVLVAHCDAVSSVGAFARFRSHGHNTADALRSSLEEIKGALGFLAGVPLDLVMLMKKIDAPHGQKGKPQPVVHCELRLSQDDTLRLMEHNLKARVAIMAGSQPMLLQAKQEVEDEVLDGTFEQPPTLVGSDGGGSLKG